MEPFQSTYRRELVGSTYLVIERISAYVIQMDTKSKIKIALAVLTMYTVFWLLLLNTAINVPWYIAWSEINFALVPTLYLAIVWIYVIQGFWKSRLVVKAILILIAGYSIFWLAVQHIIALFFSNNLGLWNWTVANVFWVPLMDALTFTALGVYRLAKRPKKKPEPYLFG